MTSHLPDEVLICFIDDESIPFERDQVKAHLRACSKCHQQYEELLSRSRQFAELVAEAIPAELLHSDLLAIQFRRKLVQRAVAQRGANSVNQNVEGSPEIPPKAAGECQPTETSTKPSFKLFKLPQRVQRIQIPIASSVTFDDGDNLFRKGHRAFAEGSLEQAIEYWREAKMVFLRLGFTKEIAACDRNVAVAQKHSGQSKEALNQFEKAKDLFKRIGEIQAMNACDLKIRELSKEAT